MSLLSNVVSKYGTMGIAQVLTFSALLLPVLTGDADKVAFAMLPLAFGAVGSRFFTLGFHATYLRADEDELLPLLVNAAWGVTAGLLVLAVAYGLMDQVWHADVLVFMCVGVSLLGQAFYVVAITMLISSRNLPRYGRVRLAYGGLTLLLTILAVTVFDQMESLVLAASIASGLAGIGAIASCRSQLFNTRFRIGRLAFSTVAAKGSLKVASGSAIGDFGAQAGAFALPFMGEYGPLWASMFRISGGFSTVAQQIFAPPIEMKFVGAIKGDESPSSKKLAMRGLIAGLALALVAAAIQWAVFVFVDDPSYSDLSAFSMVLISCFTLSTVGIGCVQRLPLLLRRDSLFLMMQVARLGGFLFAIAFCRDLQLVLAIVCVQIVAGTCFAVLSIPIGRWRR